MRPHVIGHRFADGDGLEERVGVVTRHHDGPEILLERAPQQALGTVQVRLDRAHRHLQRRGQVLVTHALEIVAIDQQLIRRRQLLDRLFETIAQLKVAVRPVDHSRIESRRVRARQGSSSEIA